MHLFTSKFIEQPQHVVELPGSVTTPKGFLAAGVAAGIKKSGKADLGLLVSKSPCASAALYTPNAAAAAPITVSRNETVAGTVQAVVVNSGTANACTGERGLADARRMVELAAGGCGIDKQRVAVASTGVIGVPIPMRFMVDGMAEVVGELSDTGGNRFAAAIRTTDKLEKEGAVEVKLGGGTVIIGACAKGAGMIAPSMATMLTFITTDAAMPAPLLQEMLAAAVAGSFNSISVDGDMSTNDFILVLANGASGVVIEPGGEDAELFAAALSSVCGSLALKMVSDGEGATKVVGLTVMGAADDGEASRVCGAIADSSLVKTAFYGREANWGRLMASAGAALAGEPRLGADIYYEEVCLAKDGAACEDLADTERLESIMAQTEISVTMHLHRGEGRHTMFFSDLTHDYVSLNAEYTT